MKYFFTTILSLWTVLPIRGEEIKGGERTRQEKTHQQEVQLLSGLGIKLASWQQRNACGPNCLYVLLACQGRRVPREELFQAFSLDNQKGVTLESLRRAACAYGVDAVIAQVRPEALAEVPLPAIAHLGGRGGNDHFVLVTQVTAQQVKYLDGNWGFWETRERGDFEQEWSGYLLFCRQTTKPGWFLMGVLVILTGLGLSCGFWWRRGVRRQRVEGC
jgi:hypothetical protein